MKFEKGHTYNSINISLYLLRMLSGHLNIDPKLYAKYQKSSSSISQDIVLTRFFYCYYGSRKTAITLSVFYGIRSKVNQIIRILILRHMLNIRILAQDVQDIVLIRIIYR